MEGVTLYWATRASRDMSGGRVTWAVILGALVSVGGAAVAPSSTVVLADYDDEEVEGGASGRGG